MEEKEKREIMIPVPKRPGNKFDADLPDTIQLRYLHSPNYIEKNLEIQKTNCEFMQSRFGQELRVHYDNPAKFLVAVFSLLGEGAGKTPNDVIAERPTELPIPNAVLRCGLFVFGGDAPSMTELSNWDAIVRGFVYDQLSQRRGLGRGADRALGELLRTIIDQLVTDEKGEPLPTPGCLCPECERIRGERRAKAEPQQPSV